MQVYMHLSRAGTIHDIRPCVPNFPRLLVAMAGEKGLASEEKVGEGGKLSRHWLVHIRAEGVAECLLVAERNPLIPGSDRRLLDNRPQERP